MKWDHYFDIYHRHFSKFVGRKVHVLEIGVFSGGSLEMWRNYFGPKCRVYGVDIAEECKAYANDYTKIFVGDQADRGFWKSFREQVPTLDILIDDGGHQSEQQIVTLEEMLAHLRPGGVYVCEDVHNTLNEFTTYAQALADNLNAVNNWVAGPVEGEWLITCTPTQFQTAISSVNLYPFVAVIEKTDSHIEEFICHSHGTEWQPPSFWEAQAATIARLTTKPPGEEGA